MPPNAHRRRFLLMTGSSLALMGAARSEAAAMTWRWQGTALGGLAGIRIVHPDAGAARRILRSTVAELRRLERIFSLFDPGSAIVELNRAGHLDNPPGELVHALDLAARASEASGGAFDVTIQPLWRLFADHFRDPGADPMGPDRAEIEAVTGRVDYQAVDCSPRRVAFARPGMGITLNGVAQGFIADRLTALLEEQGITDVLVDTGEIRAAGRREDGRAWRVAVAGRTEPLSLVDRAIATSSPAATRFTEDGRFHHLLDARSGRSEMPLRDRVTVIAVSAVLADVASTAIAVATPNERPAIAAAMGVDRVL